MNRRARKAVRCFTLVEMITVLAIIAVLAGLGVGVYFLASDSMDVSRTKTTIAMLDTALKSLGDKFGYIPEQQGSGHFVLMAGSDIDALTPENITLGNPVYPPSYGLTFSESVDFEQLRNVCIVTGGNIVVVDSWDNPLSYTVDTRAGTFRIESGGPDGKLATKEDNIANL